MALKIGADAFDVLDLEGRVALRRGDRGFDADVELNAADAVPHTAVRAEDFGLLDLFESEQTAVELARLIFRPEGDADLHVVETFEVDLHGKEKESCRAWRSQAVSRDAGFCSNAARFGKPAVTRQLSSRWPGSR